MSKKCGWQHLLQRSEALFPPFLLVTIFNGGNTTMGTQKTSPKSSLKTLWLSHETESSFAFCPAPSSINLLKKIALEKKIGQMHDGALWMENGNPFGLRLVATFLIVCNFNARCCCALFWWENANCAFFSYSYGAKMQQLFQLPLTTFLRKSSTKMVDQFWAFISLDKWRTSRWTHWPHRNKLRLFEH